MAAERSELTPEEAALLTDPQALARARAQGPVRIADRNVSGIEIPAITFELVTFDNVSFSFVEFTGTRFRNSEFRSVTFDTCQFRTTTFHTCHLMELTTTSCDFEDTKLVRSNVERWSSLGCRFSDSNWQACTLAGWADQGGLLESPTWNEMSLVAPEWEGTKFSKPQLERVQFRGGKFTSVSMVESAASGLSWAGTVIEGLELLLGDFGGVSFEQVTGIGLRIVEANCRGVGLLNCPRLAGVTVTGGECHGLVIQGCPQLSMLTLGYATVHSLILEACRVSGAYFNYSHLLSEHHIIGCEIDGLDFEDSEVEHLSIQSTSISTHLRVVNARFSGLTLRDVSYKQLEVEADGAAYQGGDMFPS